MVQYLKDIIKEGIKNMVNFNGLIVVIKVILRIISFKGRDAFGGKMGRNIEGNGRII